MELLLEVTASLKDNSLTGLQITQTWVERRVFPPEAYDTVLSDYCGLTDPARTSSCDLPEEEIRHTSLN